jgi:hypothetical protein
MDMNARTYIQREDKAVPGSLAEFCSSLSVPTATPVKRPPRNAENGLILVTALLTEVTGVPVGIAPGPACRRDPQAITWGI